MRVTVKIEEMDYCDVILKAMPVLREKAPRDGGLVSRIIDVATHLPPEVIRTILDAVPYEDKCEIVTLLVRENREKLQKTLSQLLKQNEIDVSLDNLDLNKEQVFSITVSELNYAALAVRYLPLIRDGLNTRENPAFAMLASLLKLPAMLLYGALAKIPQDKKDEAVAYLVNRNSGAITEKIESMVHNQGIRIRLNQLKVEA